MTRAPPKVVTGQDGVVGHEPAVAQHPLHHGVTPVLDLDGGPRVQPGPHVIIFHRRLGQGAEDVQLGDGGGQAADVVGPARQLSVYPLVYGPFRLLQALSGVQHHRFELLELRHDVSLRVGQGLTPDVVVGQARNVALADLDVIAENMVVTDFQAADAGAFPLPALQASDVAPSVG